MTLTHRTGNVWRVGKFEQLFRKTSLFNWSLASSPAPRLSHVVTDYWRGSASLGSRTMTSNTNWRNDSRGFDQFEWVRDLRAFGGSQARTRARRLISNWLQQNDRWTMKGWQPDIMAKRLTNLVFCYDWYGSSADEKFQGQLKKTVRLQARCIATVSYTHLTLPTNSRV